MELVFRRKVKEILIFAEMEKGRMGLKLSGSEGWRGQNFADSGIQDCLKT